MYKMYLSTLSVLTILAAILSPSQAADTDDWGAWKSQHGKRFESERAEREHRANWKNNAGIVKEHNARSDVSFRMELNYLADKKISRPTFSLDNPQSVPLYFRATSPVPDTWDWRTKGAIGPVNNQGQLGDALSFVVTECVESFHFIQTGRLVSLSEMETHDCCVQRPIASADTFDCIHGIGGLCSSADYPKSVGKCMNASCSAVAEIGGGKVVARGDEEALKEAVYQLPVLVLVDASHVSFQLYRSGVYSEPQCSSSKLDHALQVVGYGSKNGQDYWICRNSWGSSWGMNGYVLIARNKGNMCGIATMAMYPA